MHGRGRAREMVDLIDFQQDWLHHVMPDQLELRVSEMVHEVVLLPGEEIVEDDDAVPALQQSVNEVGPHEPRPAGDNDAEGRLPDPDGEVEGRLPGGESEGGGGGGGGGVGEAGEGDGEGAGGVKGAEDEEGGGDEGADEEEEEALGAGEAGGGG